MPKNNKESMDEPKEPLEPALPEEDAEEEEVVEEPGEIERGPSKIPDIDTDVELEEEELDDGSAKQ